ncbi:hypothetical protein ACWY4P_53530 (plasmid) [Streptomyces sp. LZ34]
MTNPATEQSPLTPKRESQLRALLTASEALSPNAGWALLDELDRGRAERDELKKRVLTQGDVTNEPLPLREAIEYGIRRPDGRVLDGVTTDRAAQEARLGRYRELQPNARLLERTVRHGEWTESER